MAATGGELLLLELQEQRKISSLQHSELRTAVTNMSESVSELTVVVARSEERHLRQDDGLKRIGKQVDDHERRIRALEDTSIRRAGLANGGWKIILIIATVVSFAATIGASLI